MSNVAYPDESVAALPPSKRRRRESFDGENAQLREAGDSHVPNRAVDQAPQNDVLDGKPEENGPVLPDNSRDEHGAPKAHDQNIHSPERVGDTDVKTEDASPTLGESHRGEAGDPGKHDRDGVHYQNVDVPHPNSSPGTDQVKSGKNSASDKDYSDSLRENSVPRRARADQNVSGDQMGQSDNDEQPRPDSSRGGSAQTPTTNRELDKNAKSYMGLNVPRKADAKRNSAAEDTIELDHIPRTNQSDREPEHDRRSSAEAIHIQPKPTSDNPEVRRDRKLGSLSREVASVLDGLFERGFFEERDIDERAIDFLASVPPSLALAALEDIQHRDFSTVRNKPAFIFSIFKRVVSTGGPPPPPHAPPGGFPPATVPPSALAHLPPQVSDALQRVFTSGVCHPSQFDDRAMDILVELHPVDAVRALSEFAAMEPGRVRNPSAFWMGLARKYKNHSQNGAPMGGRGPMGYGGGPGFSPGPPGGAGYAHHVPPGRGSFSALERRLDDLASMGVLRPDSLDDRAIDALRKLPEPDALSVLSEVPDPSRVRNMSAYVMGLCKKFATGEARSLVGRGSGGYGGMGPGMGYGGGGDYRELHDALSRTDPDVRDRFYAMVDRGMFPEHAFDHRAIGALQGLSVGEACAALDELAASDPRRIHNISAYFMGLAKKFGRG